MKNVQKKQQATIKRSRGFDQLVLFGLQTTVLPEAVVYQATIHRNDTGVQDLISFLSVEKGEVSE